MLEFQNPKQNFKFKLVTGWHYMTSFFGEKTKLEKRTELRAVFQTNLGQNFGILDLLQGGTICLVSLVKIEMIKYELK